VLSGFGDAYYVYTLYARYYTHAGAKERALKRSLESLEQREEEIVKTY
jgi:hypothetical protein